MCRSLFGYVYFRNGTQAVPYGRMGYPERHTGRCLRGGMGYSERHTGRSLRGGMGYSERRTGRSLRSFVHHDPFGRIIFDVFPNSVVILLIANDMIIIGLLPQLTVKRQQCAIFYTPDIFVGGHGFEKTHNIRQRTACVPCRYPE